MQAKTEKYHFAAIILHWIMAAAFFLMLASGLVMTNLEISKSLEFQIYQWHKSLGVLLLLAFFLRLIIRVSFNKPELPPSMNKTEKKFAKLGHYALYLWMFILPISGWVVVSSSVYGLPTIVFGWFEWPHIPSIAGDKIINDAASGIHEILAYIFIALIAGHIAAVIKHKLVDKENLLKRIWFFTFILFFASAANASEYKTDYAKSSLTFSGTHAGKNFSGKFQNWQTKIIFDAKNLAASKVEIIIDTASAKTGDKMYDGTLPNDDWFDVKNFPTANFISTEILTNPNGSYLAKGNLTIRGKTLPISFNFTLQDLPNNNVKANSEFIIDRLSFDIGKRSDAKAEWVSKEIKMSFDFLAQKI